jgi:hypothetical protein
MVLSFGLPVGADQLKVIDVLPCAGVTVMLAGGSSARWPAS